MTVNEQRAGILKDALNRLKKQNPRFSMRALAQKMSVTPAFLSKIMSGKTPLPFDRVAEFVHHLKMDKVAEASLIRTYDTEKTKQLRDAVRKDGEVNKVLASYKTLPEKSESLLAHWYNLAILELSFSETFKDDPTWIAKRLNITKDQAIASLHFLKAQGFLVERSGRLQKSEKNIRIPTTVSKAIVRDFYRQILKLAVNELSREPHQTEFDSRLISGLTISTNPKNIARAVTRFNEMMYEIADILHDENASEVYYIGSLLFPLTTIDGK